MMARNRLSFHFYMSVPLFKSEVARFTHGSQDSSDHDVAVQVSTWPDKDELLAFAKSKINSTQTVDLNIFQVNTDGYVIKVERGAPDEVNNALLTTCPLHPQTSLLPIASKMPRCVSLRFSLAIKMMYVALGC